MKVYNNSIIKVSSFIGLILVVLIASCSSGDVDNPIQIDPASEDEQFAGGVNEGVNQGSSEQQDTSIDNQSTKDDSIEISWSSSVENSNSSDEGEQIASLDENLTFGPLQTLNDSVIDDNEISGVDGVESSIESGFSSSSSGDDEIEMLGESFEEVGGSVQVTGTHSQQAPEVYHFGSDAGGVRLYLKIVGEDFWITYSPGGGYISGTYDALTGALTGTGCAFSEDVYFKHDMVLNVDSDISSISSDDPIEEALNESIDQSWSLSRSNDLLQFSDLVTRLEDDSPSCD